MSNKDDFSDLLSVFEMAGGDDVAPPEPVIGDFFDVLDSHTEEAGVVDKPVLPHEPLAPKSINMAATGLDADNLSLHPDDLVATESSSVVGLLGAANASGGALAQEPKPATEKTSIRIDDVGYIPGAAKERWEKLLNAYQMEYGDADMAVMPLSKLLPEPNYLRLAEDGIDIQLLANIATIRANVPAKPRKSYKLNKWLTSLKEAREFIGRILSERDSIIPTLYASIDHYEFLVNQYNALSVSLESDTNDLLEQNIHGQLRTQWKDLRQAEHLASFALNVKALVALTDNPTLYPKIARKLTVEARHSHHGNDNFIRPYHSISWGNRHHTYGDHGRINDVANTLKVMQEKHPSIRQELEGILKNEGGKTRTKTDELERIKKAIGLYLVYETRQYCALYKGSTKANMVELAVYPGDPNNASEKRAWFHENLDSWAQRVMEDRQFILRGQENSPRQGGKDWRQGRDVSPKEFAEHFGLSKQRALQYGNSLISAQNEAQARTNEAFDALNDLAEILGITPQALSLGGELAFAFGARGRGGRNPGAAHFEPSQFTINLTRKNGAGSLAHEWFHALDNHFGKQYQPGIGLEAIPFTRSGAFATRLWDSQPAEDKTIRATVSERFSELVKALEGTPGMVQKHLKSPYYQASLKMDGVMKKKVPYWASTIELAARAFEAYCVDRMAEQGMSNDFLVNLHPNRDDPEMLSVVPGRQAMEKLGIREAFDNLFESLEIYHSQNNRMILHRLDGEERQSVAALMDVVGQDPEFFRYQHQDGVHLAEMFGRYGYQVDVHETGFWWDKIPPDQDEGQVDHLRDVKRVYGCHTPNGQYFTVYESDQSLWLDLSGLSGETVTLESGELVPLGGVGGGNEIYQLVANYCFNTGKQLVGDPEGLSDIAVIRRTESMISSALRYGTTAHFLPSDQQVKGEDKTGHRIPGVQPLVWGNDDAENLSNLLKVSYNALNNLIPEVVGVYYDEERSEFRVRESATSLFPNASGLAQVLNEGRREPFQAGKPWRRLETVLGRKLPPLARAMAGSATLQRAIVLNSVLSSARGKIRREDLARSSHELFSEFSAIHTLRGKFYRDSETSAKQIIEDHHFENVVQWTREVEEATGASITVVEDSADLPTRLAKAIKPATKGIFDFASGKAYLIADRLVGRSDTIKTALHEGLGHQGIFDFIERNGEQGGQRLLALLDDIAAGVGDDAIQSRVGRYGFDLTQRSDRHQAVLEYIAHLAEENERPDLVRRVVNAQAKVLTNTFSGIVWTHSDVLSLIEATKLYRVRLQAMETSAGVNESIERLSQRREAIFWKAIQDAGGDRLAALLGAKAPIQMVLDGSFSYQDITVPYTDCGLESKGTDAHLAWSEQQHKPLQKQHSDVASSLATVPVNGRTILEQANCEYQVDGKAPTDRLFQSLRDRGMSIRWVDHIADLPEAAAIDALRMGFECVAGAQVGNELYVVGNQFSAQLLEEVILHEAVHAGVKSVVGKAMSRTYGRLYMQMGQDQGLTKEASALGVDLAPYVTAGDRLVASQAITPTQRAEMLVDEFIAHAVQSRAKEHFTEKAGRLVKEFTGGIRNTMQRHGLLHTADLSNSDLAYTLKQVHRAAMGQSHETPFIQTNRTAEEREVDAARLELALAQITGTKSKESLVEILATAPEPGNNPVATAIAVSEQHGIMFTDKQVLNALRETYDIKEGQNNHARDVFWIIRDRLTVANKSEWPTIVLAGENALESVEWELNIEVGTIEELKIDQHPEGAVEPYHPGTLSI